MRDAGFDLPESQTNFVLIPFTTPEVATAADTALRKAGILMRGMGGYGLGHCLRATIGPDEVMARAARILAPFGKETQ